MNSESNKSKDYNQSKDDILEINSKRSFDKYRNEVGQERAEGYLDAMKQVLEEISNLFHTPGENGEEFYKSPNRITTSLKNYKNEKTRLLSEILKGNAPQ